MSQPAPTAPAPQHRPRPHRGRTSALRLVVAGTAAGALAAAATAAGVVALAGPSVQASGAGTTSSTSAWGHGGDPGGTSAAPGWQLPGGSDLGVDGTGSATTETDATDAQEVGVVDVRTTSADGSEAAGTGMVLTGDGEVLTNHHVIAGATSIEVTVVSTGRTYAAELAGSNAERDVAVLRLDDAANLDTVRIDDAEDVAVGDEVTGVGNAGGDGGSASAAAGVVTGLDRSVTTSSEDGGEDESLTGMIEVDADIRAGDSGGPLYDDGGEVVGVDTAASVGGTGTTGYAIPIAVALRVVDQVEAGDESGGTTLGYPAFLGVELATGDGSATVAGVVDGSAAERAGLAAGDVVTALGGRPVGDAASLSAAVASREAGDSVVVRFRDDDGGDETVTVTLGEGPAA